MPVAGVGVSTQTGKVEGISIQIGYKTTYVVVLEGGYIFETNTLPMSEKDIEGKDIFQSFLEKIKNNNIVDIVDNEFTLWNGKKKWLQVSHTLISNENEERIILSIFRDITERKYNEELLKNISIAETSAKIKQQFLANMSHEMRTPMNGIIGMANFLDNTDLNDSQKKC